MTTPPEAYWTYAEDGGGAVTQPDAAFQRVEGGVMLGVLEQAKALAAELKRSQELQAFKLAEKQVRADQTAFQMVNKYMEMEQGLMLKQMQGQQVSQNEVTSLNSYREQIVKNAAVAQFFAAKKRFDQMWYQVNQIIDSVMGQ